ncbi:MAG TPA: DUF72 domain-containing protein [Gemmatimonadales bacterium]|nr:DUF72 domain-containing protein [Gemmatimonadales bacterium]
MARLHVGTSGYNFPEWKGSFYPPKLPSAKWLEFYAQQLGTVEINYTFYRMPNAKTVAGWDAATPESFTFVLKAPQRITHIARLQNIDESLRFFVETIRKLNAKLGAVLFQLPPNFKKDIARLSDLLTQFPTDVRAACEFRHASWWSDDVYEVLRSTNTALCIADTEESTTPEVATADFGYIRLRDEGYGEEQLKEWVGKLRELGKDWTDAFVFFKHEEKGVGPKLAAQFTSLAASDQLRVR